MTSKIIVVPIIILLSLFHEGIKVNPLGTVIAGVLWLVGSAVTTALRTAFLIKAINWYGPEVFLNLALLYEIILIAGYMVFIQVLAPVMLQSLPEGPAKATIADITSKAGYSSRHEVYFQPQVEGRASNPDAYHVGMFGTSMIVISESLMKLVDPADIGAVVAHEMGHWYHSHSAYTFTASILINCAFTEMATWSYGNEIAYKIFNFDMTDPPHPIIATILVTKYFFPIFDGFMSGLFGTMRYFCEFTADGLAVKMGLGTELRRSLLALCSKIKMFPGADSWYAAWFRAHPSMVLRIERLSQ
uniref:Peptidase M48 domain-containing protein n=1 Tax=Lygus hesperus TaxID=30085 RepID=A0A0K8SPS5_LYGHE